MESVFINATQKFSLFDNTRTSRVSNTIKSVVEKNGFGFGFGARYKNGLIIIDMFPNNGSENLFIQVSEFIKNELFQAFKNQINEVGESEFISTHN